MNKPIKLNYQTDQYQKAKTKGKLIFTKKKHEDHFPINQTLKDEIIKKLNLIKNLKKLKLTRVIFETRYYDHEPETNFIESKT